jgi:cyclic beta-1,2-glucan synthetase
MDFRFLFDPGRKLFSIGYRVDDDKLDDSHYDLLASEARLTSLVAIARGDVSVSHWFRLGRPLRLTAEGPVLVSWSGSMFEYLMPCLVTYTASHSLLDQTCRVAVERQIAYGRARGVPWGISESAYSLRDGALTYQYSAFGVPELGFKRGLQEDLVVAPYATALAAMYDAHAAGQNFDRLERAGALGAYGWYEALDYTPTRLPERRSAEIVRAYMAHHQGMTLVAIGNTLGDSAMRRRFHRHPLVESADLLLQERPPHSIVETRIPGTTGPPPRQLGVVPPTARAWRSGSRSGCL